MKTMIDQCPVCGSSLASRTVEKLVKGGRDVASVRIKAGVCHKCGEMVFNAKTAQTLEQIRQHLREGKVRGWRTIGKAYAVV